MWAELFSELPCTLREGMVAAGLNHVEVMSAAFDETEPLEAYGVLAVQLGYDNVDGATLLYELTEACRGRTRRTPGRLAEVSDADIEVWALKKRRLAKTPASSSADPLAGRLE